MCSKGWDFDGSRLQKKSKSIKTAMMIGAKVSSLQVKSSVKQVSINSKI
jgi:hypothetical protein